MTRNHSPSTNQILLAATLMPAFAVGSGDGTERRLSADDKVNIASAPDRLAANLGWQPQCRRHGAGVGRQRTSYLVAGAATLDPARRATTHRNKACLLAGFRNRVTLTTQRGSQEIRTAIDFLPLYTLLRRVDQQLKASERNLESSTGN